MFFLISGLLFCSNSVFAGKRQFATSCGVYFATHKSRFRTKHALSNPTSCGVCFSTQTCFLTKHVFPTHSFLCSSCVLAGKRQFATSCGVYLSTQTCFLTKHVFSNPFVPLFQLCLCWKTTIRNQWRGVFFPHNHVFSPNVCFPNHSLFCSNCVSAGKR